MVILKIMKQLLPLAVAIIVLWLRTAASSSSSSTHDEGVPTDDSSGHVDGPSSSSSSSIPTKRTKDNSPTPPHSHLRLKDHPLLRDWFLTFPNAYVTNKVGWVIQDENKEDETQQQQQQQQPQPQLVALTDIRLHEVIMAVPESLLVSGRKLMKQQEQQQRRDYDGPPTVTHTDPDCALTDFLVDEWDKGNSSLYYPYLHRHVLDVATTTNNTKTKNHDGDDKFDSRFNQTLSSRGIVHPIESWSTQALYILGVLVGSDLPPLQGHIYSILDDRQRQVWVSHETYEKDCIKKGRQRTTTGGISGEEKVLDPASLVRHELVYREYVMTANSLSIIDRDDDEEVLAPLVYDLVLWPHRHGRWQNLYAEWNLGGFEKVEVFATRHILAGEPLYLSLGGGGLDRDGRSPQELSPTERSQSCYHNHETIYECVTTQDLFAAYGFVEDYPRQWYFDVDPTDSALSLLVEVDLVPDDDDGNVTHDNSKNTSNNRLVLKWLHPQPSSTTKPLNVEQLGWIHALRNRFQRLDGIIRKGVQDKLLVLFDEEDAMEESKQGSSTDNGWAYQQQRRNRQQQQLEGRAILAYLDAYQEVMELAWTHRDDVVVVDEPTVAEEVTFDTLDRPTSATPHNIFACYQASDNSPRWAEEETSFHQYMEFTHFEERGDTCLSQTEWIQVCSSFRPHYHEVLLHVVAQYVSNNPGVKRVAYLGGGDSMMLHEILKYPQLEFVVGMELDQTVPRKSFTYFGTQPHFDDPRVEWWFGDASQTLLALPLEYYQSFDVVIVDLLTFIADALKVTPDMSVMDAAILLMKPDGGVLAKNEDFPVRANVGFAKYSVDLEYHDMPRICELSATIASNSVDFIKAKPNQHDGVDTLVVNLTVSPTDHTSTDDETYKGWFSYLHTHPNCEGINDVVADNTCLDSSLVSGQKELPQVGVLVIMEAEDLRTDQLKKPESVQSSVREALQNLGLSETFALVDGNFMLFVLQQGYVALRIYPDAQYVGFDIMLWDGLDQANVVQQNLIAAVGGDWQQSTSSYRFVTGGMHGLEKSCPTVTLSSVATKAKNALCEADMHGSVDNEDAVGTPGLEIAVYDAIRQLLDMFLPTHLSSPSIVAVVCGVETTTCTMLEVVRDWSLSTDRSVVVHAIYTCETLSQRRPSLSQDMVDCTESIRTKLEAIVTTTKRLDGVLLDASVPYTTGQVIHKVLSDKKLFEQIMETNSHLVLSPVSHGSDWQKLFVDRFRSEFVVFDPAHRADLRFRSTKESEMGDLNSFMKLSVFRAGDDDFFQHLVHVVADIEGEKILQISVDKVANGIVPYFPDFVPSKVFRDSDYDKSQAKAQWLGQHPIGHQTLYKFTVRPPKEPLEIGERVLAEIQPGPWNATFGEATILDAAVTRDENGLARQVYTIAYRDKNIPKAMTTRERIRKFSSADFETDKRYRFGDLVLFNRSDSGIQGFYQNGMVFKAESVPGGTNPDSKTYSIYQLETDGLIYNGIPPSDIVGQFESPEFLQDVPQILVSDLVAALETALKTTVLATEEKLVVTPPVSVAAGALTVVHWVTGTAIMKWDGTSGVEINLFTFEEDLENGRVAFQDAFLEPIAKYYIQVLSRDCFPRGHGKVVNFASDLMENKPHWL